MKKFVLIVFAFLFVLAGCEKIDISSLSEVQLPSENEGVNSLTYGGRTTIFAEELPMQLGYNGKEITVCNMDVYQYYDVDDYCYSIYAVITIDASTLEDAEYHWLVEEDLSLYVFLTSEQNEYDSTSMDVLGCMKSTDEKQITYVLQSNSSHDHRCSRKSFTGSLLELIINVTQEEVKEYKNNDGESYSAHSINGLSYEYELPEELPSSETIPEPVYSTIVGWLQKRIEAYSIVP